MLILLVDGWGISYEIVLRWSSLGLIEDKSTLVQVMALCRQQRDITWAYGDLNLSRHMPSIGHNVLNLGLTFIIETCHSIKAAVTPVRWYISVNSSSLIMNNNVASLLIGRVHTQNDPSSLISWAHTQNDPLFLIGWAHTQTDHCILRGIINIWVNILYNLMS